MGEKNFFKVFIGTKVMNKKIFFFFFSINACSIKTYFLQTNHLQKEKNQKMVTIMTGCAFLVRIQHKTCLKICRHQHIYMGGTCKAGFHYSGMFQKAKKKKKSKKALRCILSMNSQLLLSVF